MTKSKSFRWVLHALAWILFFLLPLLSADSRQMPPNAKFVPHQPLLMIQVLTNVSLLALFYLNYFLLFPYFFRNKKFIHYSLALIGLTVIIYLLQDYIRFSNTALLFERQPEQYHLHFSPFISMFFLIAALGSGVRIAEEWIKAEQYNKEIEKEKLDAELASLRAQINPHFLFNALNTIYSLTVTESDKASQAVINLSKMMRYVMQDSQNNLVPLKDEISHLENFIDFQKLRTTQKLTIEYLKSVEVSEEHKIAPLILIPFIENAFKYGISSHEESSINITLSLENNILLLAIKNKIFQSKNLSGANSGIGLNNTKRRLDLIYPNKHHLNVINAQEIYSVELKINLT